MLGDATTPVYPGSRTNDAHHERRHEANVGSHPPAGIPPKSGPDEREQFVHRSARKVSVSV